MCYFRYSISLLLLSLLWVDGLQAQETDRVRDSRVQIDGQPRSPQREAQIAVFRLSDQYLRNGDEDRAIAILEDLYAENPMELAVYSKLANALVATRRFNTLVELIEERMTLIGQNLSILSEYGLALARADRREEAFRSWTDAIQTDPEAEVTYRVVATKMGQVHLYSDAAQVLLEGREHLGQPELYQIELANLYGLDAQYEEAAEEYLAVLAETPDALATIQSRLSRLMDGDGASGALTAAINRAIRNDPLNMQFRELSAWVAISEGDFAAALEANVAIDRLSDEEGQSLFSFVQAALAAEEYQIAREALEHILDRHPEGPIKPYALFTIAEIEQRTAEQVGERAFDAAGTAIEAPYYEAALNGFRSFAEQYPNHPSSIEALARQAELQLAVFREYEQARMLLTQLAESSGDTGRSAQARLDLGRLAVQQGNISAARTAFAHVEERIRIGPLAESARLELAYLSFYEGDFDGARARVEAMNQNTATDVANDAIALKLMLGENQGPDSTNNALRAYANAAFLARRQQYAEVLASIETLESTFASHPIMDEAAFLRIRSQRALGQVSEALASIDSFPSRHPESHLLERTLFIRGEIFEHELNDEARALEVYTDFLVQHPGSLLAPEARTRIRRLRGDLPPG